MKQSKKIKAELEIGRLFDIVEKESGLNIDKKTRKQEYVFARMIYSKILLDAGYKPKKVTERINVDRCMVYHYRRTFWTLLTQNPGFEGLYYRCRDEFVGESKGIEAASVLREDVSVLIENLKKKVDKLEKKLSVQKNEIKKYSSPKFSAYKETFDIIMSDVKRGREKLFMRKVRNTINTVNSSDEPLFFLNND